MALVPAFIIASVVTFLLYYSFPSIIYNGLNFFTSKIWNDGSSGVILHNNGISYQSGAVYGIYPLVLGTVLISLIALLIAFPVSFFVTLNVELYMPKKIRGTLISFIELFAGIPSVVYGFWGLLVLIPWLQNTVEPWIGTHFSGIPLIGGVFTSEISGRAYYPGQGLLAGALILSIMIIPIITAVMTNSFETAPKEIKDGIYSLGGTRWEMGKYLLVHHSKAATYGGALLGLGRALGETMAVLMVTSALLLVPSNLFSNVSTVAAYIAAQLDSAFFDQSGMTTAAFAEAALALMGVSLLVNVIGRKIAGRGVLRGYQND